MCFIFERKWARVTGLLVNPIGEGEAQLFASNKPIDFSSALRRDLFGVLCVREDTIPSRALGEAVNTLMEVRAFITAGGGESNIAGAWGSGMYREGIVRGSFEGF